MKITITRKDWKPGMDYQDPCGCLLHEAILRQIGNWNIVFPGIVRIMGECFHYGSRKHEARLEAAHRDPSLLPITIELR